MRALARSALLVAAIMAAASPCTAQGGLNLSWNDCTWFGTLQRNFVCNSNVGTNTMVASAIVGVEMTRLIGMTSVIEVRIAQAAFPSWWQLGPGGCRSSTPSVLTADFNFVTNSNCLDPWAGQAIGGLAYQPGPSYDRAHIFVSGGIPGSASLTDVDEYYFYKVSFTNARSVGNGSCGGCSDGACFLLQTISLATPDGVGDQTLARPINRRYVYWQPGSFAFFCPAEDEAPTRTPTWGGVKSLYR